MSNIFYYLTIIISSWKNHGWNHGMNKQWHWFNETRHFLLDDNIYYDTLQKLRLFHMAPWASVAFVHARNAGKLGARLYQVRSISPKCQVFGTLCFWCSASVLHVHTNQNTFENRNIHYPTLTSCSSSRFVFIGGNFIWLSMENQNVQKWRQIFR